MDDPYSLMATMTQGKHIGELEWLELVDQLPIPDENKETLKKLKPETYLGLAVKITEGALKRIKLSREK